MYTQYQHIARRARSFRRCVYKSDCIVVHVLCTIGLINSKLRNIPKTFRKTLTARLKTNIFCVREVFRKLQPWMDFNKYFTKTSHMISALRRISDRDSFSIFLVILKRAHCAGGLSRVATPENFSYKKCSF